MNTLTSQVQILAQKFSKISLLTFIFFAFQQIHCSTQSPDDPTWQKQSTNQYIYSIDIQIIPAHAYYDELFLEPEITVMQHYFNSGKTRTKISHEILDNGSIRKTIEIWTTKNPTYCTYQNGVLITGIILSMALIHFNQDTMFNWWHPKISPHPEVQDNPQTPVIIPEKIKSKTNSLDLSTAMIQDKNIAKPKLNSQETSIPTVENNSKNSHDTAQAEENVIAEKSVIENKSIAPANKNLDEYGEPIIEKTSGLEALQDFLKGLTRQELENEQKQLEEIQKEEKQYRKNAEDFWKSERKNLLNNSQETWTHLKNNTNDIISYFFPNIDASKDSKPHKATADSTNEFDKKDSTK